MYYDPEEEWVGQVLSVKEKEEKESRVSTQETKWLKKPDGIWKKVPVETSFSSGLSRTTCPTSSSSRSSAPDAARGPVPAKQLIVDSSWNIPVLVTGSSSGESQVSPVVGNNVGFTNSFFCPGDSFNPLLSLLFLLLLPLLYVGFAAEVT